MGYLESVTDGLLIDLVTVASYQVAGSTVIVPQRIDAEQLAVRSVPPDRPPTPPVQGKYVAGAGDFLATIDASPVEHRDALRLLPDWAVSLEREGLVKLGTFHGIAGRWTLLPRLPADDVGLVTIWNERGASLQFWRSVFERRAPRTLPRIEERIAPARVGQGNAVRHFDDELLALLTEAYREAAGGRPEFEGTSTG